MFCATKFNDMNSRAKQKRRRRGKVWVAGYSGNNIVHDYKKEFKIQMITAINDLNAMGVKLDPVQVARVKYNRHVYGQQQLRKADFLEVQETLSSGYDLYDEYL